MTQPRLIYTVGPYHDAPYAVFDDLDAAKAYCAREFGPNAIVSDHVLGPFVMNEPDAPVPNWWQER